MMYGLLTKREVKMTGYWPSSFFACLWTETKSTATVTATVTVTATATRTSSFTYS